MAKVYLAMYKHKRDWRKEPFKEPFKEPTALLDFLPKATILTARLPLSALSLAMGIIMSMRQCMTATHHRYKTVACVANRLMCPITPNGI
ncbi:Uncharacterised protein [Haemophilus influenzae]|nr:Uncharacterised protein [Haemophilus influenzae]